MPSSFASTAISSCELHPVAIATIPTHNFITSPCGTMRGTAQRRKKTEPSGGSVRLSENGRP